MHRNSKHLESKLLLCTQLLYARSFINATEFTLHFLVNWGAQLKCPMWPIYSSLYCKKWLAKETLTPWEFMGQSAASHTQTINYSYVVGESSANTVQTGTVSCQCCHIHIFVFSPQFSSPYFQKKKHWFILNRCPIKYLKSKNVNQPSSINTGKQQFTHYCSSLPSQWSMEGELFNIPSCRFQGHFFRSLRTAMLQQPTSAQEQVCFSQGKKSTPPPNSGLFSLMQAKLIAPEHSYWRIELRLDSSHWVYPSGIQHQNHLPEKRGPCTGPDSQQALRDRVLWLTPQAPEPEHQCPEVDSNKHLIPLKITGWDLHPERARAEGLHSSSLRLKQHTDLNVSRAAFKEIRFGIRNEECEAIHLVVFLMLLL